MGKKKRSSEPAERISVEGLPQGEWAVTEKLRITCPVCGMMTTGEGIEAGPHEIVVKLQRFGGSFKSVDGTNKTKRGFMEYLDEFPGHDSQLEEWTRILRGKLQAALEAFEEE